MVTVFPARAGTRWPGHRQGTRPTRRGTGTATVPGTPAGLVTTTWVAVTDTMAALAVPKCTPVAPVKPTPVMVTVKPPVVSPEAGETPVTAGR